MAALQLAELQVSGDLAGLLRDFMRSEGDIHCELYAQLQSFSPSSRISFGQWWALLARLQQRFPRRHIGLDLGQRVQPAHLGMLGYLTLASDTVAEALLEFQRYQGLLHDGDKASIELQGERMVLSWSANYGPSTRLSDEVLVGGLLRFLRLMTGRPDLRPLAVNFTFAQPDDGQAYINVFGAPVGFAQSCTALEFPTAYLDLPVSNSDPGLKLLLERQAQAALAVLPDSEGFIQGLRKALLRAMQSGRANSAQVAATLNMSERTLFRRLSEQGLSFKVILAQTRTQLAQEYLRDKRLTLSEIALLLGYSEQSAFNRAFKRETGLSPRRYQQQVAT